MNIKELPSYEEIIKILTEDGSMSFIIDQVHKKRFYNCTRRLNKLQLRFKKKRNPINNFITFIYGMYVIILQTPIVFSSKELENAVLIYQIAWKYIVSIEEKELPNKKVMIIYHGLT